MRVPWPVFKVPPELPAAAIALAFLVGVAAAGSPEAVPGSPGENRGALVVGERLVYSVRYGLVKAGTALLEVKGLQRIDGRVSYQVVSTAMSNSVFDKIFPVRDRVMSLMDAERLDSHYFEKHLREGTYKADQSVHFDQEKGVARYQNGAEYPIDRGTYDVLAAFYRVRTMPLQVGSEFFLTSHADRKNYPLKVTVLGREEITTPAGRFSCLVIEPRLKSGAFFKNEGRLTIWLTDDDRRLPVLMRSKIAVGSISVVLTEYSRAGSAGPADRDQGSAAGSPGNLPPGAGSPP